MLSASHWLLAQERFCGRTHLPPSKNSTTSTGQGDIPISLTGCTCFNIHRIHNTCGHGVISAILLLILSLGGCCCLSIHWYTAPVDMMTFRWSRRSYQSICQQHPPYSQPQITLVYYISTIACIMDRATLSPNPFAISSSLFGTAIKNGAHAPEGRLFLSPTPTRRTPSYASLSVFVNAHQHAPVRFQVVV